MRPLDVRLAGPQRPLVAGQLTEFTCSSSGSRPPARLSWLKDGSPLDAGQWRQVEEPHANASHSRLALRLDRQDHGARLTCRAENSHLRDQHPDWTLEDSLTLSVQCKCGPPPLGARQLGVRA